MYLRRLTVLAAVALLAACSSFNKDDGDIKGSAEKLYKDAKDEMSAGSWDAATKLLERVEGRAGGTLLAQQAQLDLAYAYWKANDKAQAQSTIDRFIRLNPSSPAMDYALYLRGLINFNDNLGFLSGLSRQKLSERDQKASRDAFQSFKELVERFPNSQYAGDARTRMDFIGNALSEYEVQVARYYYRRGVYMGAVNRAQYALKTYPQTPALEEALYIMVQSYEKLGLDPLRDSAREVLAANFPDSRFLRRGLDTEDKPWWQLW